MFEITLIAMGKLKEKFYLSAASEYAKRLSGYCRFSLVELPECRLPENPSTGEIQAGLEKEADVILSKIPKNTWFCVFTPEGAMLSSEALAKKMSDVKICPECAKKGKAGVMSPQPVPVLTPSGTQTVTVYECDRCGKQKEA